MHEDHLESLLKHIAGNYPHISQLIRSLSPRICVSSKFPGDAPAVGDYTLRTTALNNMVYNLQPLSLSFAFRERKAPKYTL